MRSEEARLALEAAARDPGSVLNQGDGSARCALEYRAAHPGASDFDVIDAVAAYRAEVSGLAGSAGFVRRWRAARPGATTADVLTALRAWVAAGGT